MLMPPQPNPWFAGRRVCMCIHLPDQADAPYYLKQLVIRREQIARLYEGRTAEGLGMLPRLTFPQLRVPLLYDPALVYVAWRGRLRWAHRAADNRPLEMDNLANMDELLATRMHVGASYLWVFADPLEVIEYPAPPDTRYGGIAEGLELKEHAPLWLAPLR